jgi:hypothetical protein
VNLIEEMVGRTQAMKLITIVLLPGFQKGRDIKASKGKGQGAVLPRRSTKLRLGVRSH